MPHPENGNGRTAIATAVHELRNSATIIAGLASTLAQRSEQLTEAERANLHDGLQVAAKFTRRLCTGVLDAFDLTLTGTPKRSDAPEVGAVVTEVLRAHPAPHGKNLVADIETDLYASIDPMVLGIAAMNILRNAYAHGGSAIAVAARKDGSSITLSIQDDGPGLPPEVELDLFRMRNGYQRVANGGGVGLWLCVKLTEAAGTRLHYERLEPHGARFFLELRAA